jgi:hypothetical protein
VASTAVTAAFGVLLAAGALDHHAVLQAHLVAREEAEEALGRRLGEVVALDPHLGAELELALAQFRVLRVGRRLAGLAVVGAEHLGPVGQLQRHRVEHRHRARRLAFEVVAQRMSSTL